MSRTKLNNLLIKEKVESEKINAVISTDQIVNMLANYQHEERIINPPCKKFLFEWEFLQGESLELSESSVLYNWLYPIKFSIDLAILIEAIHKNINYILINRTKGLEMIYCTLNINKESFYTKIEEIKSILIKSGKVKVCSDGTVILMNDELEKIFCGRGKNAEKEIFI